MHSSFSVFCSVSAWLVTVYTIASYILSVHVRCINLYVYNIIFTAKKLPGKQLFTYFGKPISFSFAQNRSKKSAWTFHSCSFLQILWWQILFIQRCHILTWYYLYNASLYSARISSRTVFWGFTTMFPLFMASSVICAKYSSVTPASVDTPHS